MKTGADYPKGVKAIYDSPDYIDRYTVYYDRPKDWGITERGVYTCVGMSANPFHPQGFGQHSTGVLGRHNGKRITFADLPPDCQKLVRQDFRMMEDAIAKAEAE